MVNFIMNKDYGVSDIFQNIQTKSALEGYANMVTDQIDNSFFRDMYMDTMEAKLTGDDSVDAPETTPSVESIDPLYDPFEEIAEGCSKECGAAGCDGNCNECGSGACGEGSVGQEYLYGKGKDEETHAYFRSLNSIPGSDPTDAGTFFNLKDQKPSVESADASREVQDLISTIPDTDLIVSEGSQDVDFGQNEEVDESAELGLDDFGLDPLI
jgi:hypothetical protein